MKNASGRTEVKDAIDAIDAYKKIKDAITAAEAAAKEAKDAADKALNVSHSNFCLALCQISLSFCPNTYYWVCLTNYIFLNLEREEQETHWKSKKAERDWWGPGAGCSWGREKPSGLVLFF